MFLKSKPRGIPTCSSGNNPNNQKHIESENAASVYQENTIFPV